MNFLEKIFGCRVGSESLFLSLLERLIAIVKIDFFMAVVFDWIFEHLVERRSWFSEVGFIFFIFFILFGDVGYLCSWGGNILFEWIYAIGLWSFFGSDNFELPSFFELGQLYLKRWLRILDAFLNSVGGLALILFASLAMILLVWNCVLFFLYFLLGSEAAH